MSLPWVLLMMAIGVEVASTALLPRTEGFRNPLWTASVLLGYALSFWLLAVGVSDPWVWPLGAPLAAALDLAFFSLAILVLPSLMALRRQ